MHLLSAASAVIDREIRRANAVLATRRTTLARYYRYIQRGKSTQVRYLAGGAAAPHPRPRRRLDPNAIYRVPVPSWSPWIGARFPLVTLVMFTNFQCPFCKWAACIMRFPHRAYPRQLRIVFRHNPLHIHPQALPAAEAAMAIHAQQGNRGFWRAYQRIFPTQRCTAQPPMPHIRQWLRTSRPPEPRRRSGGVVQSTHLLRARRPSRRYRGYRSAPAPTASTTAPPTTTGGVDQ